MAIELAVVVPDVLVRAPLKELEEVTHVPARLHDLLVQVALGDPADELLDTVVGVQHLHIDLLSIMPRFTSEAVVQDQGLLVGFEPGNPPPCLDLPQVAASTSSITVLFPRKLWGHDLVVATSTFIRNLIPLTPMLATSPWVFPGVQPRVRRPSGI